MVVFSFDLFSEGMGKNYIDLGQRKKLHMINFYLHIQIQLPKLQIDTDGGV